MCKFTNFHPHWKINAAELSYFYRHAVMLSGLPLVGRKNRAAGGGLHIVR